MDYFGSIVNSFTPAIAALKAQKNSQADPRFKYEEK
jgi:hypothetical protein